MYEAHARFSPHFPLLDSGLCLRILVLASASEYLNTISKYLLNIERTWPKGFSQKYIWFNLRRNFTLVRKSHLSPFSHFIVQPLLPCRAWLSVYGQWLSVYGQVDCSLIWLSDWAYRIPALAWCFLYLIRLNFLHLRFLLSIEFLWQTPSGTSSTLNHILICTSCCI